MSFGAYDDAIWHTSGILMGDLAELHAFARLPPLTAHARIERGLKLELAQRIFLQLDMALATQSHVLNVPVRTLQRWSKTPKRSKLDVQAGNQLYQFSRLFDLAIETFGSTQAALEWFSEQQPGLNNEKPLQLVSTNAGARSIEQLLGRIRYGVYT